MQRIRQLQITSQSRSQSMPVRRLCTMYEQFTVHVHVWKQFSAEKYRSLSHWSNEITIISQFNVFGMKQRNNLEIDIFQAKIMFTPFIICGGDRGSSPAHIIIKRMNIIFSL